MRERTLRARFLGCAALLALAPALGGCITGRLSNDVTGSVSTQATPRTEDEWRRVAESLGERYRSSSQNAQAAIQYAHALRASGQKSQAAAVLEQASIANPGNKELLGAYGRALADVGNFKMALDVLNRAHTPDNPDWRILSVQGASLDQLGRHDEARAYYESALRIVPDEPTVLSNLGLSYALTKNLPKAEATLRRAYARGSTDQRVRQNLALVVGLQGRFDEAEAIAKADLPPDQAAANVAYLRDMIGQQGTARRSSRGTAAKGQSRS